eukprot:TRINITY_DN42825_c0_g1_i1.p2 TRINITY_DN42825_c0_g1~~TRINITY_DN42825_c0_g1_i1.p2  ORF type:complete len:180 (-),score=11.10 TRINITY_DN42825_c0_g1_i1:795-1334(-)
MKIEINALLTFVSAYRRMEKANDLSNKKLIKNIVPPRKFDHLFSSWSGRNNDFGSFYLNLEYALQGKFVQHWNIQLSNFTKYLKDLEKHPYASLFTVPPEELLYLNALVLFFNNNGIDPGCLEGFEFSNLPEARFGNSANWGDYILSLPPRELVSFFHRFDEYSAPKIAERIDIINSFK